MHPILAFVCFFRILFGRKLPVSATEYFPEEAIPKQLGGGKDSKPDKPADKKPADKPADKKPSDKPSDKADKPADKSDKPDKPDRPDKAPKIAIAQHHRDGALAFLALLQREGRLVDFLREPLDGFSDGDIGAAARDVHRGCRKVLEQHLSMEAVMPGAEEEKVSVPKGFDPAEIRLVGEAKGEPPFKGTLRHHGWRVTEAKLPQLAEGVDRNVIAPAEVEL